MSDEVEIKIRRLMQQLEHQFIEINKLNISDIIGEIRESDFVKLAEAISVCRANYLKEVLKMANSEAGEFDDSLSQQVNKQRLLYEETMLGFDALRHALERGYFGLLND